MPLDIRYEATSSFLTLLGKAGCSLALTVYMSDRVILLSASGGTLRIHSNAFARPMGLATRMVGGVPNLAVATFQEVVMLADAPLLGAAVPDEPRHFDHVLVPRMSLYSGDIDAHDLVWVGDDLLAANTRFSCISRVDRDASFTPVWVPPFVTKIAPEDRCHLNGIAANDERLLFATAFGATDEARGWNALRAKGGVLLELPSGRPVLEGLAMPHSPRVFDDELYVLESGMGHVLRVDPVAGTARTLAALPGFVRGLDRYGDVLFVGMSRTRDRPDVRLPVKDRHATLKCGVAAIDRRGTMLGWLHFGDTLDEIFDVKVLPHFSNGAILGVEDERHRRALVLPGRAFWGEPIEDVAARHHASQVGERATLPSKEEAPG